MAINLTEITKSLSLNPIILTHDQSSWTEELHKFNELPLNKEQFIGKKVIFLIRDIKDTLVSSYFAAYKRDNKFSGTISEFIRSDFFGIKKILMFYKKWDKTKKITKDFLLLSYEGLYRDPFTILKITLKFLGFKRINNNFIEKAVEFSSFDKMKKMEKTDYFHIQILRSGYINDNESFKVRKGIIGGYTEYLSEEDIKYIDTMISKMGNPFLC